MSSFRLTFASAVIAGLLFVTGCGVAGAPRTPQAQVRLSTPCKVSADRIDDYRRLGLPLPSCLSPHPIRSSAHSPCLVVADRVQDWIDLRIGLPHCVRALQRSTH